MYLVSRTETFAKLFFIVSFTGLFIYVALAFYSFHTAYTTVSVTGKYPEQFNNSKSYSSETELRFEKDLKYILVWIMENKHEKLVPKEGQATFIESKCPDINCYITTNESILNDDYTNFDAIVFNMSLMSKLGYFYKLPSNRSKHQKFVFYGKQPSDSHPICDIHVENFFNWTWSYKFYSDIFSPFIEVKDLNGKVVAPSRKVVWTTHLKPTTKIDIKVNTKSKAMAWVIDDCKRAVKGMEIGLFIRKLSKALIHFNLTFDVYGCGNKKCPNEGCLKAIERDYYFYLVSEDSMSQDYVTAEVLKGYHHDAVPVVFGDIDYTKFLPQNSYLNYQNYTVHKMAALINYAIMNPAVYQQYFKWKNYYTIEKVEEYRGYCELCRMLNDKTKYQMYSTYKRFRNWWYYGPLSPKCLPDEAQTVAEASEVASE